MSATFFIQKINFSNINKKGKYAGFPKDFQLLPLNLYVFCFTILKENNNMFLHNMEKKEQIKGKVFDEERSLYNLKDAVVLNCTFSGEKDGESPFKEARNIEVDSCSIDLRYAFWHVQNGEITNTNFSSTARAPFWYDDLIKLNNVNSQSVKIFRECKNVEIDNSTFISEEPFWRCKNLTIKNSKLEGFYAFFQCKHITVQNLTFKGKYSFQYNRDVLIENSSFDTKDAFWHCNQVVVANSTIKGEYIGWYCKNVTFINCTIESHQPFCYSRNLRFINCKMVNCDLAFENSTVKGNIIGEIDSIKNPIRCNLIVDNVKEVVKVNSLHKVSLKLRKPTTK